MRQNRTAETHADVMRRLDKSADGVDIVFKWLDDHGRAVEKLEDNRRAPTEADWKEYVDNGDLLVDGYLHVEVKQLTYRFTGRKDWPFGSRYIVCAKSQFHRKDPRPDQYVTVSPNGCYAAVVDVAATFDRWYKDEIMDWNRGIAQDCYLCPVNLVKWRQIGAREGGPRD